MSINFTLDNNFIMDETMLSMLNEISEVEAYLEQVKALGIDDLHEVEELTKELNQKQIELMIYVSNRNFDRINQEQKNEN